MQAAFLTMMATIITIIWIKLTSKIRVIRKTNKAALTMLVINHVKAIVTNHKTSVAIGIRAKLTIILPTNLTMRDGTRSIHDTIHAIHTTRARLDIVYARLTSCAMSVMSAAPTPCTVNLSSGLTTHGSVAFPNPFATGVAPFPFLKILLHFFIVIPIYRQCIQR